MIKKVFFILLLNRTLFSLHGMEQPAEEASGQLTNTITEEHLKENVIQPMLEGLISFLHALQHEKLSLQKKEASGSETNIEKKIFFVFSHFEDSSKIYEVPMNETCEILVKTKGGNPEKLIYHLPIESLDIKAKSQFDSYTSFWEATDLKNKPWQESKPIKKNRKNLIKALLSKDVDTIEAALKLKIQPETNNWIPKWCSIS